jgi:hypothetical protein
MKIYADCQNGLMKKGDDSYVTEVVSEKVFLDLLDVLKEDEYIRCDDVSEATFNKLEALYGIHG